MRAMGQVWSSVMSRVARDIEKSMEMRFWAEEAIRGSWRNFDFCYV